MKTSFFSIKKNYIHNKKYTNYSLCFVTDSIISNKNNKNLLDIVSSAVSSGCKMIQYREKSMEYTKKKEIALKIKEICKDKSCFIVNDDVKLALDIESDGIHVGQDDMFYEEVRKHIGEDKVLGVTVGNSEQIKKIVNSKANVDYFGTDAIFETSTKPGKSIGVNGLCEIINESRKYKKPVIAIGGLTMTTIDEVLKTGVDGVAMVSEIIKSNEPGRLIKSVINKINNDKISKIDSKVLDIINSCKEINPLVLQLTNKVVMNQSANITLAVGGSPIMSSEKKEIRDLLKISNSLLVNIGTINDSQLDIIMEAIKIANEYDIPIVLDPVGVGASKYRLEAITSILNNSKISIIKGNSSEIGVLSGKVSSQKGVDSNLNLTFQPDQVLSLLSQKYNSIFVMTGKTDYISNGIHTIRLYNNQNMLTKTTGTGCMLGSIIATYAGCGSDLFISSIAAILKMTVPSEMVSSQEPHEFYGRMMDFIYKTTGEEVINRRKIELV